MKKLIFLILIFAFSSQITNAVIKIKQKKVLFIGNSLTYWQNMPETLQKMCDEQKIDIKIDKLVNPGWKLVKYAIWVEKYEKGRYMRTDSTEISVGVQKILSDKWDMVVLQEAGGYCLIPEFNYYSFEPSLIFLDSVIKSIKSKTVLYQGYTKNLFPYQLCCSRNDIEDNFAFDVCKTPKSVYSPLAKDYQYCSKYFQNSIEEFNELKVEYDKMSHKLGIDQVKIGYAYEEFKRKYPKIPIYVNDTNAHPSPQGAYLIACLFFKYITGRQAEKINYSAYIDEKQAKIIRKFADTIN